MLARLKSEGAEVIGTPPDQAALAVRKEMDKWAEVVKTSGAKID